MGSQRIPNALAIATLLCCSMAFVASGQEEMEIHDFNFTHNSQTFSLTNFNVIDASMTQLVRLKNTSGITLTVSGLNNSLVRVEVDASTSVTIDATTSNVELVSTAQSMVTLTLSTDSTLTNLSITDTNASITQTGGHVTLTSGSPMLFSGVNAQVDLKFYAVQLEIGSSFIELGHGNTTLNLTMTNSTLTSDAIGGSPGSQINEALIRIASDCYAQFSLNSTNTTFTNNVPRSMMILSTAAYTPSIRVTMANSHVTNHGRLITTYGGMDTLNVDVKRTTFVGGEQLFSAMVSLWYTPTNRMILSVIDSTITATNCQQVATILYTTNKTAIPTTTTLTNLTNNIISMNNDRNAFAAIRLLGGWPLLNHTVIINNTLLANLEDVTMEAKVSFLVAEAEYPLLSTPPPMQTTMLSNVMVYHDLELSDADVASAKSSLTDPSACGPAGQAIGITLRCNLLIVTAPLVDANTAISMSLVEGLTIGTTSSVIANNTARIRCSSTPLLPSICPPVRYAAVRDSAIQNASLISRNLVFIEPGATLASYALLENVNHANLNVTITNFMIFDDGVWLARRPFSGTSNPTTSTIIKDNALILMGTERQGGTYMTTSTVAHAAVISGGVYGSILQLSTNTTLVRSNQLVAVAASTESASVTSGDGGVRRVSYLNRLDVQALPFVGSSSSIAMVFNGSLPDVIRVAYNTTLIAKAGTLKVVDLSHTWLKINATKLTDVALIDGLVAVNGSIRGTNVSLSLAFTTKDMNATVAALALCRSCSTTGDVNFTANSLSLSSLAKNISGVDLVYCEDCAMGGNLTLRNNAITMYNPASAEAKGLDMCRNCQVGTTTTSANTITRTTNVIGNRISANLNAAANVAFLSAFAGVAGNNQMVNVRENTMTVEQQQGDVSLFLVNSFEAGHSLPNSSIPVTATLRVDKNVITVTNNTGTTLNVILARNINYNSAFDEDVKPLPNLTVIAEWNTVSINVAPSTVTMSICTNCFGLSNQSQLIFQRHNISVSLSQRTSLTAYLLRTVRGLGNLTLYNNSLVTSYSKTNGPTVDAMLCNDCTGSDSTASTFLVTQNVIQTNGSSLSRLFLGSNTVWTSQLDAQTEAQGGIITAIIANNSILTKPDWTSSNDTIANYTNYRCATGGSRVVCNNVLVALAATAANLGICLRCGSESSLVNLHIVDNVIRSTSPMAAVNASLCDGCVAMNGATVRVVNNQMTAVNPSQFLTSFGGLVLRWGSGIVVRNKMVASPVNVTTLTRHGWYWNESESSASERCDSEISRLLPGGDRASSSVICGNVAVVDFQPAAYNAARALVHDTSIRFCTFCIAGDNSTLLVQDNYFEAMNVSKVDAIVCNNCRVDSEYPLVILPRRSVGLDMRLDSNDTAFRNVNATITSFYAGLLMVLNNSIVARNGPSVPVRTGKTVVAMYNDFVTFCASCTSTAPNGLLLLSNNTYQRGAGEMMIITANEGDALDNASYTYTPSSVIRYCARCEVGNARQQALGRAKPEIRIVGNVAVLNGSMQINASVGSESLINNPDGIFVAYANDLIAVSNAKAGSMGAAKSWMNMMESIILLYSQLHMFENSIATVAPAAAATELSPLKKNSRSISDSCLSLVMPTSVATEEDRFMASVVCGNKLVIYNDVMQVTTTTCQSCTAINVADSMRPGRVGQLHVHQNHAAHASSGYLTYILCDGCIGNVNVTNNNLIGDNDKTSSLNLTICRNCGVSSTVMYNATTSASTTIEKSANLFFVHGNNLIAFGEDVTFTLASFAAESPMLVCGNHISIGLNDTLLSSVADSVIDHSSDAPCRVPSTTTWSVMTNNTILIRHVKALVFSLCRGCHVVMGSVATAAGPVGGALRVANESIALAPLTSVIATLCLNCSVVDDGEFTVSNNEFAVVGADLKGVTVDFKLNAFMSVVNSTHRVHWNEITSTTNEDLLDWYTDTEVPFPSNLRAESSMMNRSLRQRLCSTYLWETQDSLSLASLAPPGDDVNLQRTGSFMCGNTMRCFGSIIETFNVTLQQDVHLSSGGDSVVEHNYVNHHMSSLVFRFRWCNRCVVDEARLLVLHNFASVQSTSGTVEYYPISIRTTVHELVVANNPIIISPLASYITEDQIALLHMTLNRRPSDVGINTNVSSLAFNNSIVEAYSLVSSTTLRVCDNCVANDSGMLFVAHNNVSIVGWNPITDAFGFYVQKMLDVSLCSDCKQLGASSSIFVSHNVVDIRNATSVSCAMLFTAVETQRTAQWIHHNVLVGTGDSGNGGNNFFIPHVEQLWTANASLLQCPTLRDMILSAVTSHQTSLMAATLPFGESCGNLFKLDRPGSTTSSLVESATIAAPWKMTNNTIDVAGLDSFEYTLCSGCTVQLDGVMHSAKPLSLSKSVLPTQTSTPSLSLQAEGEEDETNNHTRWTTRWLQGQGSLVVMRNAISQVGCVSASARLLAASSTSRNQSLFVSRNMIYQSDSVSSLVTLVDGITISDNTTLMVSDNSFISTFSGYADSDGWFDSEGTLIPSTTSFTPDEVAQQQLKSNKKLPAAIINNSIVVIRSSDAAFLLVTMLASADARSNLIVTRNTFNLSTSYRVDVTFVKVINSRLSCTQNVVQVEAEQLVRITWLDVVNIPNGFGTADVGILSGNVFNITGLDVDRPIAISGYAPDETYYQNKSIGEGSTTSLYLWNNVALLHSPNAEYVMGSEVDTASLLVDRNVIYGSNIASAMVSFMTLHVINRKGGTLTVSNNTVDLSHVGNFHDSLLTTCPQYCSSYSQYVMGQDPFNSFEATNLVMIRFCAMNKDLPRAFDYAYIVDNEVVVEHVTKVQCSSCVNVMPSPTVDSQGALLPILQIPLFDPSNTVQNAAMIDIVLANDVNSAAAVMQRNVICVTDVAVSICDAYYGDHPLVCPTQANAVIARAHFIDGLRHEASSDPSMHLVQDNTINIVASPVMPVTPLHQMTATVASNIDTSSVTNISSNVINITAAPVSTAIVLQQTNDEKRNSNGNLMPVNGALFVEDNVIAFSPTLMGASAFCVYCNVNSTTIRVLRNLQTTTSTLTGGEGVRDTVYSNMTFGSSVVALESEWFNTTKLHRIAQNSLNFVNFTRVNASVAMSIKSNASNFVVCGNMLTSSTSDSPLPTTLPTSSACSNLENSVNTSMITRNKVSAVSAHSIGASFCRDCVAMNGYRNATGSAMVLNNSIAALNTSNVDAEFFSGDVVGDGGIGLVNASFNAVTIVNASSGTVLTATLAAPIDPYQGYWTPKNEKNWRRAVSYRNEYTFENANVSVSLVAFARLEGNDTNTFYIHSNMFTSSPTDRATVTTAPAGSSGFTALVLSNTIRALSANSSTNATYFGGDGLAGKYAVTSNTITIPGQSMPDAPGAVVSISNLIMPDKNLTLGTGGGNTTVSSSTVSYIVLAGSLLSAADGGLDPLTTPTTTFHFAGVTMQGLSFNGGFIVNTDITITGTTFSGSALVRFDGADVTALRLYVVGLTITERQRNVMGRYFEALSGPLTPNDIIAVKDGTLRDSTVTMSSTTFDLQYGALIALSNATLAGGSFTWDSVTAANTVILRMDNGTIIGANVHIQSGGFTATKELFVAISDCYAEGMVFNITSTVFAPATTNTYRVAELGSNNLGGMTVYYDRSTFNNYVAFHNAETFYRLNLACTTFDGVAGLNMRRDVYLPFGRLMVFRETAWNGRSCVTFTNTDEVTASKELTPTTVLTKSSSHTDTPTESLVTRLTVSLSQSLATQSKSQSLSRNSPTPSPSGTPSPTLSLTPSKSDSKSPSMTGSVSPSPSLTETISKSPSMTESGSPSPSLTETISLVPVPFERATWVVLIVVVCVFGSVVLLGTGIGATIVYLRHHAAPQVDTSSPSPTEENKLEGDEGPRDAHVPYGANSEVGTTIVNIS